MGFDAGGPLPYLKWMFSRGVFHLTIRSLAGLGLLIGWPLNAGALQDTTESETPLAPRGGFPGFPGFQMPPGVHIFGPQDAISPDLRGGIRPRDQGLGAQRPAVQPEKKPTEAERTEALRKALAPKPSALVLRQRMLDQLFQKLAAAEDDETAKNISATIEHIWAHSESDTANLLMERGSASLAAGKYPLALAIFDKLVALRPQWAEAWNKRATTRFRAEDFDGAMADIDQVLKLEPRHYGALAGMGLILQRTNLKKQALDIFRKALALNPRQPELRELIEKLTLDVEGRDI